MAQHSCSLCSMSEICLPLGVEKHDLSKLEALIQNSKVHHSGDFAIRQGDNFTKIYAVKSGTYKSFRIDENGNEHVIGFHLAGELFGLDAIYLQYYPCSTVALDTTVLCEMEYDQLSKLCTTIPALQKQLLRLLSHDIHISHMSHALQADQSANQKLASFLHNLSVRYHARGYSATNLTLTMTRQDIANYLGLAPETISRLLKQFQQQNILDIQNRQVTILNPEQLLEIVHCGIANTS